ncbi:MAG: ferrous iron transport protein A [Prevotellaceae bacterium]|nr:ferrous iron transport protein A [Candidatus Colivivens equi]
MPLSEALSENDYIITSISTDDEEFTSFLFTLGCYSGEKISLISRKKNSCTIGVKDAKYNIDTALAQIIEVEAA